MNQAQYAHLKRLQFLRQQRMLQAIQRRLPQFSIPVADSAWTAPGWIHVGMYYSCIPDCAYPWDPAVLRAIRSISPDYIPLTVKSVWRWSNYHEQGKLGEPVVLTHHAIGRVVRDSSEPTHEFACEMPAISVGGLRLKFQPLALSRPNLLEVNPWHDRLDKRLSPDLPGAYLPFDWELYYALRKSYTDNKSVKDWNEENLKPYVEMLKRRKKTQQEERDYIERDRQAWELKQMNRKVVGDSDWEAHLSGHYEDPDEKHRSIRTTVPDLSKTKEASTV